MSYIKHSIDKFNIEEYLNDQDLEYQNTESHFILKECPFCGGVSHKSGRQYSYKFYLSKDTKQFFCHICSSGQNKNLAHLISVIEKITYHSAYTRLIRKSNITKNILDNKLVDSFNHQLRVGSSKVDDQILPKMQMPYNFYHFDEINLENQDGYNYLLSRGLNIDLIRMFDIRYCPTTKRIIFPVYLDSKVVGWQGRDITNKWKEVKTYPKSLTSKGFKKSRMLYGYDRIFNAEHIMIVEGPVDAIKSYLCNGVALFGKSMSKMQYSLIRGMPNLKKITIALDSEESIAINDICQKLNPFYDVFILKMPLGTDPGDYSPNKIIELLDTRKVYNYLEII